MNYTHWLVLSREITSELLRVPLIRDTEAAPKFSSQGPTCVD